VFGSLCCLVADQDQSVKNASELLDRLLKGLWCSSLANPDPYRFP
jgi:hypothetical protein